MRITKTGISYNFYSSQPWKHNGKLVHHVELDGIDVKELGEPYQGYWIWDEHSDGAMVVNGSIGLGDLPVNAVLMLDEKPIP